MIYHNKLVLSAIAASFIVSTGGGALCARYQQRCYSKINAR
ncbi:MULTISPECIES: hypothetical protein [unclassified Campylobacter]|nr:MULTISPECIES: hypothetical protein [unclassified Campylobacter]